MSIEIRSITVDDSNKWDDFVFHHPRGSIYHNSIWGKVLQVTYGYRPLYLALQNVVTSEFEGVCPFMLVNSKLTGKRLVSLPFSAFCPLLVPETAVTEVIKFALAQHQGVRYLEIKLWDDEKVPHFLQKQSSYLTHLIDLSQGEDSLLKSFHPTSVRQRIARAARNRDLTLRMAQSEDDVRNFFKLHTAIRKKHGLPPPPYSFFSNMWRLLAPKKMLSLPFVEYQGRMICAAVVLKYKDTVSFEYSACDTNYFDLSANQMLTWEVIRTACEEGLEIFDFGRTSLDNQSLLDYKDRWGASRRPLNYYYFPNTRRPGVEGSLGRQILARANRMLPDALLQLEGRYLYRHLG